MIDLQIKKNQQQDERHEEEQQNNNLNCFCDIKKVVRKQKEREVEVASVRAFLVKQKQPKFSTGLVKGFEAHLIKSKGEL